MLTQRGPANRCVASVPDDQPDVFFRDTETGHHLNVFSLLIRRGVHRQPHRIGIPEEKPQSPETSSAGSLLTPRWRRQSSANPSLKWVFGAWKITAPFRDVYG